MADLFTPENFEATGYDATGWTESVGSGCSIDPDADPADVGSPTGWGSKCFQSIRGGSGGKSAMIYRSLSNPPDSYFRDSVVIASSSMGNEDYLRFAETKSGGSGGSDAWGLNLYLTGGNYVFYLTAYHDGNYHEFYSDPISLNTRYLLEVGWDANADTWGWRIDEEVIDSGVLSGTHVTSLDHLNVGFINYSTDVAVEMRHDLVRMDDTTWVGEPAAPGGLSIPTVMHHHRMMREA